MENKLHGDLTKVNRTYAHTLALHKKELEQNFNKPLAEYKKFVNDLVLAESNSTAAQRNFLLNLQRQRSNHGVLQLCWNVMLKADNLEVIR